MRGNIIFLSNILNLLSAHKNIVTALVEMRDQEQYMDPTNEEEKNVIQAINSFIENLNNMKIENNDIINNINQCIYNKCNHKWITDTIDVSLDTSKLIIYCDLCGKSNDNQTN